MVPLGALYKVIFSCLKARILYLLEDCKETLLSFPQERKSPRFSIQGKLKPVEKCLRGCVGTAVTRRGSLANMAISPVGKAPSPFGKLRAGSDLFPRGEEEVISRGRHPLGLLPLRNSCRPEAKGLASFRKRFFVRLAPQNDTDCRLFRA